MPKDDILENLDLVFDKLNDGLLLLSLSGKILKVNDAMLKMGGYSRQEIEGKNAMKLVKIFSLQSLKKIAASFADAIKGVPGDRYELEARTKEGETKIIEVSNSVIKKQGKVIGIVVTARENTSRIDFEKKIRESEERYKALYNSSQDAIMTLEPPDWRFTSGNPATVKMFKTKDEKDFVSGASWQYSPKKQSDGQDSGAKAKKMIEIAMEEGSNFFEWTHKRKDGQDFPATVSLARMELRGKKFLQATVREITDQKRAEEELKNKMEELEKVNQLMVGRELKMVELKKEIQQLKSGMAIQEKKKSWKEKFQEAVDLEEGVIRKYESMYINEVDKSNLNIFQKRKAKRLLNILIKESIEHENHFKELIKRENAK